MAVAGRGASVDFLWRLVTSSELEPAERTAWSRLADRPSVQGTATVTDAVIKDPRKEIRKCPRVMRCCRIPREGEVV